ncbi:tRNA threonylcarbamoyladenosine biosynthesis protein TsaE [Geothermobacter ehrlichii]|uniref:tRNA threonylcarbamoyladenosine biosynthesis protein TsaE n=1 Tax=Geothermobacter ehrlichii TaxID=213224 RepID=A0A5D3WEI1_9BACT|nr:tRNA (adenosine(37)-N6)-threonylcarbamoyltransferase complex ATPase subunit type 1 TsaE [Geothermobacter ehrlichii]TYO95675.1 tRNA threonylcarbamoyladenosine biosynthesis protein TsaE [Geothermobacter ehrlichii]
MSTDWQLASHSDEATRACGRFFGRTAAAGDALFLCGELGAGKTCFAKGVAEGLGVPASVPVTSPSYTLLNLYQGRLPLYHFDLYRLGDPDELLQIGFDECLYGQGVTLVEWLDRFPDLQPDGLLVRLDYGTGAGERHLSFTARGTQAAAWLQRARQLLAETEERP